MIITATELKSNLGKYLDISNKEDIFITKYGKIVAKISNPHIDTKSELHKLIGIIPSDFNLDDIKDERLGNK